MTTTAADRPAATVALHTATARAAARIAGEASSDQALALFLFRVGQRDAATLGRDVDRIDRVRMARNRYVDALEWRGEARLRGARSSDARNARSEVERAAAALEELGVGKSTAFLVEVADLAALAER